MNRHTALLLWSLYAALSTLALLIAAHAQTPFAADSGSFPNMPVQCIGISSDLANKPMSACPGGNQKFARAIDTAWVRTCKQSDTSATNPTVCTYKTMVWTRWGAGKNSGDRFDVCTVSKTVNDPAYGTGAACSSSGGTDFSAMKQVAPYEVATVPPLPPAANFTVDPANGPAPLNVHLAWNVPNMPQGTPCQANSVGLTSNAQGGWSGAKSAVGADDVASVMESTRFTLSCVASKGIAVVVSWQPPTQNIDGTPATDINGYTVVYGQDPRALSQSAAAAGNVSSLIVQDYYFKADQTWYFAVRATNNGGNQSDISNISSLTLVKPGESAAPFSGSIEVTITGKVPLPPTGTTTRQVDAPNDTAQIGPSTFKAPPKAKEKRHHG